MSPHTVLTPVLCSPVLPQTWLRLCVKHVCLTPLGACKPRVQPSLCPVLWWELGRVLTYLPAECVSVVGIHFFDKCLCPSVPRSHVTFLLTVSELCATSLRDFLIFSSVSSWAPVLDPSDFLWPSGNSPEKILVCGKQTGRGFLQALAAII